MSDQHFNNEQPNQGAQGIFYGDVTINQGKQQFPPPPPFMAPVPPPDFVPRPQEFDQLLDHLLSQERSTPVALTASLTGAGGFGKTTLAQALCHDERVRSAFPDGILWVTLGERPGDLTGRINGLAYKLTGEHPNLSDPHLAAAHLAEKLTDRTVLLVIDDVWNSAHLKPFLQGGARCTCLITTRNRGTLPLDTYQVDVDAMRQHEAVALLIETSLQHRTMGADACSVRTRLQVAPTR